MKKTSKTLVLLVAGILTAGAFTSSFVAADDDERKERRERGKRLNAQTSMVVNNPLYTQECGSCHFLFPPGLLPARSWQAVMREQDKHFGENLGLDEATSKELLNFLTANAADKIDNRRSKKIAASIPASAAPLRITETAYIVKKHRKIGEDVFKRPSIGSFSNCGACHTKGAQDDFEEDSVVIPKK